MQVKFSGDVHILSYSSKAPPHQFLYSQGSKPKGGIVLIDCSLNPHKASKSPQEARMRLKSIRLTNAPNKRHKLERAGCRFFTVEELDRWLQVDLNTLQKFSSEEFLDLAKSYYTSSSLKKFENCNFSVRRALVQKMANEIRAHRFKVVQRECEVRGLYDPLQTTEGYIKLLRDHLPREQVSIKMENTALSRSLEAVDRLTDKEVAEFLEAELVKMLSRDLKRNNLHVFDFECSATLARRLGLWEQVKDRVTANLANPLHRMPAPESMRSGWVKFSLRRNGLPQFSEQSAVARLLNLLKWNAVKLPVLYEHGMHISSFESNYEQFFDELTEAEWKPLVPMFLPNGLCTGTDYLKKCIKFKFHECLLSTLHAWLGALGVRTNEFEKNWKVLFQKLETRLS